MATSLILTSTTIAVEIVYCQWRPELLSLGTASENKLMSFLENFQVNVVFSVYESRLFRKGSLKFCFSRRLTVALLLII